MWCCESACTACPSLSQEMTGAGCPVASQWRTTVLLTTAPISSMNSSDAPIITGGTEEVNTTDIPFRNNFQIVFFLTYILIMCTHLPRISSSKCMRSSPASLTAWHVYFPASSLCTRVICSTCPPEMNKTICPWI